MTPAPGGTQDNEQTVADENTGADADMSHDITSIQDEIEKEIEQKMDEAAAKQIPPVCF